MRTNEVRVSIGAVLVLGLHSRFSSKSACLFGGERGGGFSGQWVGALSGPWARALVGLPFFLFSFSCREHGSLGPLGMGASRVSAIPSNRKTGRVGNNPKTPGVLSYCGDETQDLPRVVGAELGLN